MVGVKVKGNRIEFGEWFILIRPYGGGDLLFRVYHKEKNIDWHFNTLEEAWEKVNERNC